MNSHSELSQILFSVKFTKKKPEDCRSKKCALNLHRYGLLLKELLYFVSNLEARLQMSFSESVTEFGKKSKLCCFKNLEGEYDIFLDSCCELGLLKHKSVLNDLLALLNLLATSATCKSPFSKLTSTLSSKSIESNFGST